MITTNKNFKIKTNNGLVAEVPEKASIYVHVTDNNDGTHAVNGKIVLVGEKSTTELGWIRTGKYIPSNTANLLGVAHDLVIAELETLNPKEQFIKSI